MRRCVIVALFGVAATPTSWGKAGSSGIEGAILEDFASCECRDTDEIEGERVELPACFGGRLNCPFIFWNRTGCNVTTVHVLEGSVASWPDVRNSDPRERLKCSRTGFRLEQGKRLNIKGVVCEMGVVEFERGEEAATSG